MFLERCFGQSDKLVTAPMHGSYTVVQPIEMPDREIADNPPLVRRFCAIKDHLFSDLAEEAVILSLKNGKYYGVNQVGASIWSIIQQATTLADIESRLMDEYEVDETTCRAEVALFLETMIREKLINVIDE